MFFMCFSATASFATAGVLFIAGALALRKAHALPTRYFAAIPLLFAIQQTIEGIQWLVDKPSCTSTTLGYGFLFFAFLVWPFYTPFSVMMMEQNAKRRKLLRAVTWFGAAGSAYLLVWYLTQPLTVAVVGHSIDYDIAISFAALDMPLYLFAVCTSFLSTRPRAHWLAITTLFGFIVTLLFYRYAFTSVWCFFAAALSVVVLAEVYGTQPKHRS